MKLNIRLTTTIATVVLSSALTAIAGNSPAPSITGDYLEVRSCDVYTGSCFANAEMGLGGKEAILVWSIREGVWNDTHLDGLSAIAVLRTDATLGDVNVRLRPGKAMLILDSNADAQQQKALADMVKQLAGKLIDSIVEVQSSPIVVAFNDCTKATCASVKAGKLVDVKTRCLGEGDHVCGNESVYYPPLTKVRGAMPAFTELASFQDDCLDLTWSSSGQRSAFIGKFER